MRNFLLLLFAIPLLSSLQGQDAKIVISGIIDGPLTGGTPKALEIFVRQDIADLSTFSIGVANNGGGTDGPEYTFPADAVMGGTYIYVTANNTEFNTFFGFDEDYVTGIVGFNGDDAVELFEGTTLIDTYGDVCCDGTSSAWEYMDGWATRTNISSPTTGLFNASDWSFSGPNALDGETSNATATNPFPIASLPVELTHFRALKSNNKNILTWATASEVNNEQFEIQRSNDGSRFYPLGSVKGQGESNELVEYDFIDYSPINGKNYYRLKQMDFNGDFEYSDVVFADNRTSGDIKIYPTVTADYINIDLSEASAQINLYNIAGQLLISQTLDNKSNVINVSDLANGTYFISIKTNGETLTQQIVKQ